MVKLFVFPSGSITCEFGINFLAPPFTVCLEGVTYVANLRGCYRVANDALARYEIYKGDDASPDFTAAAWATSATLPYETAALTLPAPGNTTTFHLVTRYRNAYNLLSQNVNEFTVEIDSTGAVVATHPSAPVNVSAVPAASLKVRVTASYLYDLDKGDQATKWLIYTKVGSDPVPGVDSPAVETMSKSDGVAKLDYLTSAYTDGQVVHVIVRTRRVDPGSVNVDSTNTTAVTATVDDDGPGTVTGAAAFFGTTAAETL